MKMAKASQQDMDMAMELCRALDDLSDAWHPVMPQAIATPEGGHESEAFALDDPDQCRRVIEYLRELTSGASLFRVVYGMAVLLDPKNKAVDPDSDVLEHHPEVVAALEAVAKLDLHSSPNDKS